MSDEIQLAVIGLTYNQNVAGTYGLVLGEVSGNRRFSIIIGESDATMTRPDGTVSTITGGTVVNADFERIV